MDTLADTKFGGTSLVSARAGQEHICRFSTPKQNTEQGRK
jgi:hypothetical protein